MGRNNSKYCWFSAILSCLQKSEKWVNCFPSILRMKFSLQMCCNLTVCSKIRVIKFKFCCNPMISQPLPNFKSQFSQKEEVGSYDNVALNQRFLHAYYSLLRRQDKLETYVCVGVGVLLYSISKIMSVLCFFFYSF